MPRVLRRRLRDVLQLRPVPQGQGAGPTHQVINLARASGFDNVHDYLVHGVTGATPAQLLQRKTSFAWGRWLLNDFTPATPTNLTGPGRRPRIG